jgi:hypothetical protein
MQRIFTKKYFLFTVGSVCHIKRFTIGSRTCHLGDKLFSDDEELETEARKWLRRQSKDFCAAGFDTLVKRSDKYINVGGGYVEKYMFFQVRISHVLPFIFICKLLTDSFSY